jgi:hypothetical protein
LYAIDRSGDLYAWNFASGEQSAAMHAQNLHAIKDLQLHFGNIVAPHCLISQSGIVSCWAFEHALGKGDWASWEASSEPRIFSAVTEPILKGVDLTKMHPQSPAP